MSEIIRKTEIREEIINDILTNSNIVSGEEYRELICAIAKVASDVVVKTLGPYGATTMIDDGTGFTYPTKDGWTCLSKILFTNPTYNAIFNTLKKISFNSLTTVGDGTTTAMVVASNFLQEMYLNVLPEISRMGEFRQADFVDAMKEVQRELEKRLRANPAIKRVEIESIAGVRQVRKLATIATNGNEKFAEIISKIYDETGNPYIQVSLDASSQETTYEIQTGYKFRCHVLGLPAYLNDPEGVKFKHQPRKIVIFDHNVNFQTHNKIIACYSALANRDNMELIICAPYFDDVVSAWIESTAQKMLQSKSVPNIMLAQIPVVTDADRYTLADLSILTNSQIFDNGKVKAYNLLDHNQTHPDDVIKDPLLEVENYKFASPEDILVTCLGTIESGVFGKNDAFIQDYEHIANMTKFNATKTAIEEELTAALKKAGNVSGYTMSKEFMFIQSRHIKLSGNTGVIKVGGTSDIQQRCDKDLIDDAVFVCRSAVENGYVRGLTLEILSTLYKMKQDFVDGVDRVPTAQQYIEVVVNMLYNAFYKTSISVITNKNPDLYARRRIQQYTPEDVVSGGGSYKAPVVYNLSTLEILDMCITDKHNYDYDLRVDEMHSAEKGWTVVNSMVSDIEILRAVVNVLTTVITSNQFLSSTRRYNPITSAKVELADRLANERAMIDMKLDAVKESGILEILSKKGD